MNNEKVSFDTTDGLSEFAVRCIRKKVVLLSYTHLFIGFCFFREILKLKDINLKHIVIANKQEFSNFMNDSDLNSDCSTLPQEHIKNYYFVEIENKECSIESIESFMIQLLEREDLNHYIFLMKESREVNTEILYQGAQFMELTVDDFMISMEESKKILKKSGFAVSEVDEIASFTEGDLSLIQLFISERKEADFDIRKIKKRISNSIHKTLHTEFTIDELMQISKITYLRYFNYKYLDAFYIENKAYIPIIKKLKEFGFILSPEEDFCQLNHLCKKELKLIRLHHFTYSERVVIGKKMISILEKYKRVEEALKLSIEVEDRDEIERLLITKYCVENNFLREKNLLSTYYPIPAEIMKESLIYNLLSLVVAEYEGNSQKAKDLVNQFSCRFNEFSKEEEYLAVTLVVLSALVLLENCEIERSLELINQFIEAYPDCSGFHNSLIKITLSQLELVRGNIEKAKKLYNESKYMLDNYEGGGFLSVFLALTFAQLPGDYFREISYYERIMASAAKSSKKQKCSETYMMYKIFSYITKVNQGKDISDSEMIKMLPDELLRIRNLNIRGWGYFLLSKYNYHTCRFNLSEKYINETIYYGTSSGNRILVVKSRFLLLLCSIESENYLRAKQILNELKETPYFVEIPLYKTILMTKEAQLLSKDNKIMEAYKLFRDAYAIMNELEYPVGLLAIEEQFSSFLERNQERFTVEEVNNSRIKVKEIKETYNLDEAHNYSNVNRCEFIRENNDLNLFKNKCVNKTRTVKENPVEINLFGEFTVKANGEIILEEDWQTRKVRGLFHYLLINKGKRISRKTLAKMFWSNVDDDIQAAANLRVALSLLSKTLRRIELENILCRNRQKVWIELDENAYVDYFEAKEYYSLGKEMYKSRELDSAEQYFLKTLHIVEQSYLLSQNKEVWAAKEKGAIKDKTLKCLYYLLHISLENENYSKAVVYCKKMLEKDHYREDIYYILIGILKKLGRIGEAIGVYKKCHQVLKDELSVKPSSRILKLGMDLKEVMG